MCFIIWKITGFKDYPNEQQNPPVLETSDLPNNEAHVEPEGDHDQNTGSKNYVNNLQDHVKDSETSPQVEKDKGTYSTEHIANLSSNSNTQDQSASSVPEVFSKAGQEAMERRFKQDFIKDNIFEVVEKDPNAVFSLKAFLGRLQNPRTHEGLLFLVTQAELHLDQFARDFQKRANNQQTLEAQIKAHSILWLQANNYNKSVADMKRQSKDALKVVASCDVNIAK
jgi:hypothetical protein